MSENLQEVVVAYIAAADEIERIHRVYQEFMARPEESRYPQEWRTETSFEHGPAEQAVVAAWEAKREAWQALRLVANCPDPLEPLEPLHRYPINNVGRDTRI